MPDEIINGYRMHYEVYGQGPAFVMLHGGLGGGEGCAALVDRHADALSDHFRLIFCDRRGAGRSETPADGYSMEGYAQDVRCLLDHLGVSRAHMLGTSAGGPIAMRFALDYPEMTQSLILINTMTYVQEPQREVRRRELENLRANEAAHGRAGAVERAVESRNPGLRQADPERFQRLQAINLEQFDGLAKTIQSYLDIGDSIESRLSELAMPIMIAHGDADSRIPVTCALELRRGLPDSEFHIFPGAEHGLMTNEADRLRDLIVEFLMEVPNVNR